LEKIIILQPFLDFYRKFNTNNMIEFIEGTIVEKTPTYAVINCSGMGYLINISLHTYSHIPDHGPCKLWIHQVIREDAHLLYGFAGSEERILFRNLITVQGVGAGSARMILSSLGLKDVFQAIMQNNPSLLQTVKGIGMKTAQKIILDLRDKLGKEDFSPEKIEGSGNTLVKEALSALSMLGFPKNLAEKAVNHVIKTQGDAISIEELIKGALKIL
jgi:holliday junction DNA helicase RuvA